LPDPPFCLEEGVARADALAYVYAVGVGVGCGNVVRKGACEATVQRIERLVVLRSLIWLLRFLAGGVLGGVEHDALALAFALWVKGGGRSFFFFFFFFFLQLVWP
jgi:hypothetical protein